MWVETRVANYLFEKTFFLVFSVGKPKKVFLVDSPLRGGGDLLITKPKGGGGAKGLSGLSTKKKNLFCGFP